jgi:prophage tail gpP-like protein
VCSSDLLDPTRDDIQLTGRDKTEDLVDCSAPVRSFSGQTLDQIATQLAAPFGIKVIRRGDIGGPFRHFAVNPGDSIGDCLDRLARQRGVYAYTEGTGCLIVGDVASSESVGQLVLGENLESINVTEDATERYSIITVVSQHDNGDDWNDEQDVITGSAVARDKTVPRYRPLVIVAETQGEGSTLAERAAWEVRNRRARGLAASATASGWLNPKGTVWRPGQTVDVVANKMNATGSWLINTVQLTVADQGAVAQLSLLSPAALERTEAHARRAKKDNSAW